MTIKDTENKIGQLFSNTLNITKKENASDLVSSFAEEFHRQLASISNTNPNKPATTETSESDTMVEEFKNTLGTKGALTFFQDYNNEKIEKMIGNHARMVSVAKAIPRKKNNKKKQIEACFL